MMSVLFSSVEFFNTELNLLVSFLFRVRPVYLFRLGIPQSHQFEHEQMNQRT